jgi:YebC/PmpR family DNA-binding regulatory protein
MAGHSKWANIKHRKERADAKKGKVISRCAKEIISAVKMGGTDPKANSRLRLAIEKAKAANVPNEVVERNIKKASAPDQAEYHEITYELYGHGGVGIIVEIMTDNKNRIASDIRIATNKKGGTIANPGSVAYNFERKGVIHVSKKHAIEEELFQVVIDAGAEDFKLQEDLYVILTDPSQFAQIQEAIEKLGFKADHAALEMVPKMMVECDGENFEANMALIEWLENIEDVDVVYSNMNMPSLDEK